MEKNTFKKAISKLKPKKQACCSVEIEEKKEKSTDNDQDKDKK
ncbi:hypothetical protein [Staphylococcus massiliensis]|nr:hypothetical protein [Staphylococcus massiliensis]